MTPEATLRRRLDKAGWTKTGNCGVAWLTVVAHRTICVQVERFSASVWRSSTLIVDGRGSFKRVVVGEAHAPTFELAVGEVKRMRERIESQIEALLLDLSTKSAHPHEQRDTARAEAFNARLAAINAKAKNLLAKLEAPKDHVINLTGLRGVGPWVGEGLTAALQKADKLRDAYRDTKAEAHRLAEVYRRQYPDAKAFRVGPRKKAASK